MAIDRVAGFNRITRDAGSEGFEKTELATSKTPERNGKVDEVAKMYEKQFLREMVKAMRSTVSFGAQKPSMAENIYREQLDEQYVEAWGDKGGVGLSGLIYDQLMERYFNSPAGRGLKAQGAGIPLTDRDISRVVRVKTAEGPGQVPLRIEVAPTEDGKPAKVQSPWEGKVLTSARLDNGKTALTLGHEGNLRSTFVFQGVLSADVVPGAQIGRGTQVGVLSPEIHSFLWNLQRPDTAAGGDSRPGLKLE
jgi:flagellar protein FlgJ